MPTMQNDIEKKEYIPGLISVIVPVSSASSTAYGSVHIPPPAKLLQSDLRTWKVYTYLLSLPIPTKNILTDIYIY